MYYNKFMTATFESEKNKKALAYTAIICIAMLLMAILISWKLPKPPVPLTEDLIEINLGNDAEGFGEVQPLIKGEKSQSGTIAEQQTQAAVKNEPLKDLQPEDNKDLDAAPVAKIEKTTPKATNTTAVLNPAPKKQIPKIAGYGGPNTGKGNGSTEDNGYTYQGNNPNGKGDIGNPKGKPDSYGNQPGGILKVIKGNRDIVNNYIFMGELPKATINAVIKVSPEGRGTFVDFDKGSTNTESRYASAIKNYLPNIQFNKSDHESIVTVPFNFRVQ